jgi:hypothetical protein
MKNNRAQPSGTDLKSVLHPVSVVASPSSAAASSGWTRFWFTPVSPFGLHCLRVLAGLLFLGWLLPLAGDLEGLFGMQGWFDREAYAEVARLPQGSPLSISGWSFLYFAGSDPTLLQAAYWGSIAILVLFTLGVWTRLTAVLTWVIVASFLASPAARYDADYLLALLAFYLMIGYLLLGQWSRPLSLFGRLLGTRDTLLLGPIRNRAPKFSVGPVPSYAANLTMRLLQVNLAIVFVVSGLHKLQMGVWWGGVALWYPLHAPFETTWESIQPANRSSALGYLFLLSVVQYAVLAWEIGFPLFAWRKRWRPVLLGGAVLGWLGCAFIWKLPLFGPVFLIGCLSFLSAGEWQWIATLFSKALGQRADEARMEPRKAAKVEVGL